MYLDPRSPEFEKAFADECVKHQHHTIKIDMDLSIALVIIANLQLALRHPSNVGTASAVCRHFVDGLIERAGVTDLMRRALKLGDDPSFDGPIPKKE